MTEDEKKKVKAGYVALSAYYQRPLEDYVLRMYAEDLEDMPFGVVIDAMIQWRKNPKNRTLPLPAELRNQVTPALTDEQLAIESVARIVQAMSKHGSYNPDAAREFMGDLAWEVVKREGGWVKICATENKELPFLKSQWLKVALSVQAQSRAGKLGDAPRLPSTFGMQQSISSDMQPRMLGDIAKDIMEGKK